MKYDPDLVVWFDSGSGFRRLNDVMFPLIKSCEEKIGSDSATADLSHIYDCWDNAQKTMEQSYSIETYNEIMEASLRDFFLNIDPNKVMYFTFDPSTLSERGQQILSSWVQDFPSVDFSSTIPDIYSRNEALPDLHPNKQGHLSIATAIFNYLNTIPLTMSDQAKP